MKKAKGQRFLEILKEMISKVMEKNLFTESAALSYYFALSLVPLLVLTLTVITWLGPDTLTAFSKEIVKVMGDQGSDVVTKMIESTKSSPHARSISEIFGVVFLIISASSVFSKLKEVLSNIFENEKKVEVRTTKQEIIVFLKEKLFAVTFMVVFILLAAASGVASIFTSFLFSQELLGPGAEILNQLASFGIYTIVFSIIFYIGPTEKVPKYNSIVGGIVAAIGFLIGRYVIAKFLTSPEIKTAYGAAGSFIVLLAWVYYSSFIFFVSAILTTVMIKPREENSMENSADSQPKTPLIKRKKTIIAISIIGILIGVRMVLPYFIKNYLNDYMEHKISGYTGHMEGFGLSLYRGAYQVEELTFKKKDGKIETPFIAFKKADISVSWKGLFQGKILANLVVDEPKLNFVDSKKKGGRQLGMEEKPQNFVDVYKKIVPFDLETLKFNDGEIHFFNKDSSLPIDIFMNKVQLEASNIHNTKEDDSKLFSKYKVTSKIQNKGNLESEGSFDLLSSPLSFNAKLKIEKVHLVDLNKFFLAYGPLDLTSGTFYLYLELASKKGKVKGYIKPIFEKVKVISGKENMNTFKRFGFEYGTAILNLFFRNGKTLDVATKIPVEGDLKNPKFKFWPAFKTAFSNTWGGDRVEKKLDHDVSLKSVDNQSNDKGTKLLKDGKNKDDKKKDLAKDDKKK